MALHEEPERQEKREGIIGEVCDTGLEVVGGIIDIGGAVIEAGGSVIGGAADIAAGAGEALSGCAGCAPVIILALLLPMGLIGHLIF